MSSRQYRIYQDSNQLPCDRSVLIMSPHPDDTSIAVGGVAHMLAGRNNRVVSVVMTSGHRADIPGKNQAERIALRESECRSESAALGIDTEFLRLPLYDTGSITTEDIDRISALFEATKPDIVFMPNLQDPHPTHALCTSATMRVLKTFANVHSCTIESWFYESPWSLFHRDDFNTVVAIPEKSFAQKLAAIRAHASQNQRTKYDDIALSLARLHAEIVPEQQLAGYGDTPPDLGEYVELYSIHTYGANAQLVQSLSGIRGIYEHGLTEEIAENYGYVYGTWLKLRSPTNPKVVVGRDTRPSGPQIMAAIQRGLARAHCHIFAIDTATTPMVQFEVRNRQCDGGVIITASHNPSEWNGFKFLDNDGSALTPEHMQQVIGQYHELTDMAERPYVVHYIRFLHEWLGQDVIDQIRNSGLRAVLDPNGGAMVIVIADLFDSLGIETITLNMQAGVFPHAIEPSHDALAAMAPVITEHHADFGVAWDCDGDRVELMLPDGNLLSGQMILAMIVDQVLSEHPQPQTIAINAQTSGVVAHVAKKYNATIITTDVGEANVVSAMKTHNAIVGGEGGCGGGIIPPSRGRDGAMTLLKIIQRMLETKQSLSELVASYPRFTTLQANLRLTGTNALVREKFPTLYPEATCETFGDHAGALKLTWPDGSFLCIRESKTEPNLLRVFADGIDSKATHQRFTHTLDAIGHWAQT